MRVERLGRDWVSNVSGARRASVHRGGLARRIAVQLPAAEAAEAPGAARRLQANVGQRGGVAAAGPLAAASASASRGRFTVLVRRDVDAAAAAREDRQLGL